MMLVDANLLLYAYDATSSHHEKARHWWEECLSQADPVRLSWHCIVAFVRISTHTIMCKPLTIEKAAGIVEEWLQQPMVSILEPTGRHWTILQRLLVSAQTRGNLVTDAHLAALAIEHGATFCTNDRDFARFPGLLLRYPLDPQRPRRR